ncbi:MAG: hypothetical protein A2W28_03460 [Gammaproteobacteria bacterium RBG_16_51_14]|nr:MAG: hypothetical protein A2W28_03460 [Gammaproteobacteria bacterium RBG_16_51_14]
MDAHAFFEGLLPEGKVRQRICRQLGISLDDDAGLLFAIGEDCAGALSILPAGVTPGTEREPPKKLTMDQINRLVRSLGEETSALAGRNQRFSLAGAQEKQPVIFDGVSYALPDRGNPSGHILKFETVQRVCFAELIANDMARLMDLPVAATEFLESGKSDEAVPYLRIERYDRMRDASGNLIRLHQEDLLQALGVPTIFKYQHDGGPSIKEVAEVLRENTARPIDALSHLRDWQIFNYLIGNWDGHGKNLALLYAPDQAVPALAPFYDLVAIEFLNLVRPGTWSRDMAFSIGDHHEPERITRADWVVFAKDLGMPPKRVLGRLEELATCLPEIAGKTLQAFTETHDIEVVSDRLEESIRRRCHWTLNSVFANRPAN